MELSFEDITFIQACSIFLKRLEIKLLDLKYNKDGHCTRSIYKKMFSYVSIMLASNYIRIGVAIPRRHTNIVICDNS